MMARSFEVLRARMSPEAQDRARLRTEQMDALISREYRGLQRELHSRPQGYGQRGRKWASVAADLVTRYQAASVLDYGAGRGSLAIALCGLIAPDVRIAEFDPAIAGLDALPAPADLVVCTDVLEHVEPEKLDAVLTHLRSVARKAVLLVVSTCETAKILADGRMAHLIVEPASWWINRLQTAGFTILDPPDAARKKPDKEFVTVLEP